MSGPDFDALDDFAGPGGWDEGARPLGLRLYGVDYDRAACETARAAGHEREQADITEHESPEWARGRGYVSSPSCTLFSIAGSGVGRLVLDTLAIGIRRIFAGEEPSAVRADTQSAIYPVALAEAEKANKKRRPEKRWDAERVETKARLDAKIAALVIEPARRIMELDPEWVALEQVPEVLLLWRVYAHELCARGWSCWAVVLNAANYGVAQTRQRAILGASRVRATHPPEPTHTEHPQDDDLFGASLARWVCMADALGWGWEDMPSCTVTSGGAGAGGPEIFASADYRRRLREYVVDRRTNSRTAGGGTSPTVPVPVTRPAPTLTGKSGSQWVVRPDEKAPVYVNGNQPNAGRRSIDEPAPTVLFGHRSNDVRWVFDRPATTVVGSFKPDVIAEPGYRTDISRQDAPGSVSVSVSEAGVLQSFRPDYPWDGLSPAPHVAQGFPVEDHFTLLDELKRDALKRGVNLLVLGEGLQDNQVLQAVVGLDAVDVVDDLTRLRVGDQAVLRDDRSLGVDVAVGVNPEVGRLLPALVRVERITSEPPLLPVPRTPPSSDGFAFTVLARRLGGIDELVGRPPTSDALVVHEAETVRSMLPVTVLDLTDSHVSSYQAAGSSRSKQYEQVGNAIPPLLAAHVLSAVTGLPIGAAPDCAPGCDEGGAA